MFDKAKYEKIDEPVNEKEIKLTFGGRYYFQIRNTLNKHGLQENTKIELTLVKQ